MSRSVTEAASGAGQIAANISGVSGAADSTTQALTQTRTAVDELSRMAADLRTSVSRFTYSATSRTWRRGGGRTSRPPPRRRLHGLPRAVAGRRSVLSPRAPRMVLDHLSTLQGPVARAFVRHSATRADKRVERNGDALFSSSTTALRSAADEAHAAMNRHRYRNGRRTG